MGLRVFCVRGVEGSSYVRARSLFRAPATGTLTSEAPFFRELIGSEDPRIKCPL